MGNKLIIVLSGKKKSGKSSAGKFIFKEYINNKIGQERFVIEKVGKDVIVFDAFNNNQIINLDYPNQETKKIFDTYSIKTYSFADPLKEFCVNVLGLSTIQCYGSDDDKNSNTHLMWENISEEIREKYKKKKRGMGKTKMANGAMTAREVMQVFGTDICRRLDENCWARGTYSSINNDGYELAIVTDGRFPNEITMGTEIGAKAIRFTRNVADDNHESEKALDNFPLGEFSLIIDNHDLSMLETHKILKNNLNQWFKYSEIIK
jgi:hypothetical protein